MEHSCTQHDHVELTLHPLQHAVQLCTPRSTCHTTRTAAPINSALTNCRKGVHSHAQCPSYQNQLGCSMHHQTLPVPSTALAWMCTTMHMASVCQLYMYIQA
jgi:hypothetical protein